MPRKKSIPTTKDGKHIPEYGVWAQMKSRCQNPNTASYRYYGGRGIFVCRRWQHFANFLADMGRRPSKNHSIDRIDNDGPYSPENCRWATSKQQSNNTRSSVYITHKGQTLTATQWGEKIGIPPGNILNRLAAGWSVEDALFTYIPGVCKIDGSFVPVWGKDPKPYTNDS